MTLSSLAARAFAAPTLILALGTSQVTASEMPPPAAEYTFPLQGTNMSYCNTTEAMKKTMAPHIEITRGELASINLDYVLRYFPANKTASLYLIDEKGGLSCSVDGAELMIRPAPAPEDIQPEDFSFLARSISSNVRKEWCGRNRIAEAEVRYERDLDFLEGMKIADLRIDIYAPETLEEGANVTLLLSKGIGACIVNAGARSMEDSPFYSSPRTVENRHEP